jgi:hypothetical protein
MLMLKSIALTAGVSVAVLGFSAPAYANNSVHGNSNAGDKVTICHATGSNTNPYVQISPNANGVVAGHAAHQDERDIIPQFQYNDHGSNKHFPGQNWDTNGQATYNNGCKPCKPVSHNPAPAPAPKPTPTPGRGGGVASSVPVVAPAAAVAPASQITAVPQGAVNAGYGEGTKAAALIGLASSLSTLGLGARLLKR